MIVPAIGVGPLGAGEWNVGGVGASATAAAPSGSGSFGSALSNAIGSLEATQTTATQSAQELATGKLKDPTTAVTSVENASLSMDYASQIRNQITTDATTIFQTQL